MVGDVRGMGLMVGIELVKDKRTQEKAPKLRNRVVKNAVQKQGLWILGSGQNCLRLTPSYVIAEDELDSAVDKIENAIKDSV